MKPSLADRLKAGSIVVASGCIEWTGRLDHGYGSLSVNDKNCRAHRAAWMVVNGPITRDVIVCHRCDNRKCINVAHLFVGTHADNAADKVAKKRQARGARHGSAKITEATAQAIRSAKGTQRSIAAQYGLSQATVWEIRRNLIWRDSGGG